MRSSIVPGLLILIGVISLSSFFAFTVPKVVVTTYMTSSILTANEREILLDYTTTTISCTGVAPVCFVEVSPYTYTATWSGQTTPMLPVSSTTTTHVAYASSGLQGDLAAFITLLLIIGGIVLFTIAHWRRNSDTREGR